MDLNISQSYRTIVLISFIVYTVILMGIVVVSNRAKKKNAGGSFEKNFFVGGRKLSGLVLGVMMMATLGSSGMFIGAHGGSYALGLAFAIPNIAAPFAFFLILAGIGKKVGIVSRRIEAVSVTGLIKSRFNNSKTVVAVLALAFMLFLSFYSAAQIISGARVFEFMTGSSYIIGLLLFSLVVGVYTLSGGMKSVASASFFQGLVMIVSIVCLFIGFIVFANNNYGSVEALMKTHIGTQSEIMLAPSGILSPSFVISLMIMIGVAALGMPHVIQGTMSYKNTKSLKRAILIGFFVTMVLGFALILIGPMVRAIEPNLTAPDFAMPYLTFKVLSAPLAGIILSGVAAAIQSTIAAMMLIICSSIAKDLYKDVINPKVDDKKMKWITMAVMAITVLIVVVLSIKPPEILQMMVLFSIGGLGSAIIVPLTLGLYWKRTNEYGAISGILVGLAVFIVGSEFYKPLALGMNAFVVGIVASAIATVVVTLLTPKPHRGIIEVWFGKTYNKEFALSRQRISKNKGFVMSDSERISAEGVK